MEQNKIEYVLKTDGGRTTMVWDQHSLEQARRHATRVGKPLYKRTTTIVDEVVS